MDTIKTLFRLICFIGLAHLLIIGLSASAVLISFGETATGTISSTGQNVSYTFTATARDTIYTRMDSSWDYYPQIRLYAPNGTLIATSTNTISTHATDLTQILPLTGTYTLLVGDNVGDSTGSYGLFLQRTNKAGNAEGITFGVTRTDSITKLAEMKNYTFTATTGDTIYTRLDSSWDYYPQIRLYAPNGTLVATSTNTINTHATDLTQILPLTGKYTILVGDNVGDSTGAFGLFLQRTNKAGNAEGIAFGVTRTDSITKRAEMKNYTFNATARDTIYTRLDSSWDYYPQIRLYAPNGTLVATSTNTISTHATDLTQILPLTGTYTLLVGDNVGDSTGAFGLFLQRTNKAGNAEGITFGVTKTDSITKLAEMKNYTFTATTGDTIYTRMDSSWDYYPQIRLYAPDGTLVATSTNTISTHATDLTQILPLTGKYTLLVGDNVGDSTGSYGLFLQRTNNSGNAQAIAFGTTVTDSITKLAEMKNYTFNATAKDTIYTRLDSSWDYYPQIRLYAPDGTLVATSTNTISTHSTDLTQILPLTGTYTLLVGDNVGDSTGSYGLFLQRTNKAGNAEGIAFGVTRTDSITKLAEMKNYTFTATTGDTIYTRLDSSWDYYPQIRLYAPNGTLVATSTNTISTHSTDLTQKLPLTGTYTLLVGDNVGDSTGSYGLFLQRTNNSGNAQAIAFGTTVTDSITKLAEMKNYTFNATAKDTIYTRLDSSWDYYPQIRLYAPDGTLVATSTNTISTHATDLTQKLPLTGTYTLLVGDNVGDSTGAFGLFLQRTNNPGHAQTVAFGTTVSDSITKLAEMKNYTFTATIGDTIYTRLDSSWDYYPQIRLYAPNGTLVATSTNTISTHSTDLTQILSSSGKYTILVGDNVGDSTGSYGLFLQRTNNSGNAQAIAFGTTVTDSITKQAEMKNYTFNATARDTIYTRLDSGWDYYPQIRLYAPNGTLVTTSTNTISTHSTDLTQILSSTGTYTLLVGDNVGDSTGSYGLFLQRTNNPGHAQTIAPGANVTDSITRQAEMKNYTFTGTTGNSIYTRMDSGWDYYPQIRLYAPNGTLVAISTHIINTHATDLTQILSSNGKYTLLVGDNVGDSTGSYRLILQ